MKVIIKNEKSESNYYSNKLNSLNIFENQKEQYFTVISKQSRLVVCNLESCT